MCGEIVYPFVWPDSSGWRPGTATAAALAQQIRAEIAAGAYRLDFG
jgi:hypothetical protein